MAAADASRCMSNSLSALCVWGGWMNDIVCFVVETDDDYDGDDDGDHDPDSVPAQCTLQHVMFHFIFP